MSGLADELLADLDGLSGNESEQEQPHESSKVLPPSTAAQPSANNEHKRKADALGSDEEMSEGENEGEGDEGEGGQEIGGLVLEGGVKPADELDAEDVQQMELGGVDDIGQIAKLENSKRMTDVLKVSSYMSLILTLTVMTGSRKVPRESVQCDPNGSSSTSKPRIQRDCTS